MRFTKILDFRNRNWWMNIRNGDTYQVTGKDGSQFKTHADNRFGMPLFKDGKGKILTPNQVAELVLISERY